MHQLRKHFYKSLPSLTSICLFLLVFSTNSYSNSSQVDSLLQVINETTNDSLKIKSYIKIGIYWETQNFDSSLNNYNRALEIAEKNNWINEKAKVISSIGFAYYYGLKSKISIDYLKKGLEVYRQANNQNGILDSYYNLGHFYSNFDQHKQAIEYLEKAVVLGKKLNNKQRLAMIYNNLGLMYQYTGKHSQAIEPLIKSLKLKEELGDKTMFFALFNIGINYVSQDKYDEGLDYYQQALDYSLNNNNKSEIALSYKNIGDVYNEKENFNQAIEYYDKAFELFKELNDSNSISRYYLSMGQIYYVQDKHKRALKNYKKALSVFPEKGSPRLLSYIHSDLATFYYESNNFSLAIHSAKKAYDLASETGLLLQKAECSNVLFQVYQKLKKDKLAVHYANEYIQLKDSLVNKQKIETLTEVQTKFETEKKELEIASLNKENELKTENLAKSNALRKRQLWVIYLLVGGFLVTSGLLLIIYRFYQQKKKSNVELATKNDLILQQNEEKEALLKEIHHRVKNNLQIISSLLDLQSRSSDNPTTKAAVTDGQNRVKSMALIHQMLYQNDDAGNINFKDYIQKLLAQISTSQGGSRKIEQQIDIPKEIEFDIDTAIPLGLVVTELLTNAYKYAFEGRDSGRIDLKLITSDQKQYELLIGDDGQGLPVDFDIKKTKSLGLRLVRTLIKQVNGKVNYESNQGAKFTLFFTHINTKKQTDEQS